MYVQTQASRRRSPSEVASVSASPQIAADALQLCRAGAARCGARAGCRWPSASASAVRGRCASAASACSKQATASRLAERSNALVAGLARVASSRAATARRGRRDRPAARRARRAGRGGAPRWRRRCARAGPAAGLARHAAVGHVLREGVLERVLDVREHARLVEELGARSRRRSAASTSSARPVTARSRGKGTTRPITEATSSSCRSDSSQPVRARQHDLLHRVRHRHRVRARRQDHVARPAARRTPVLLQRADQLLDEERVALGLVDDERVQPGRQLLHAEQLRRRCAALSASDSVDRA